MFTRLVGAPDDEEARRVYKFFLDTAGGAWNLYQRWKKHPEFRGTRLRSIEREGGTIVEVPDGIIFPILGALSMFFVELGIGWRYLPSKLFNEKELIDAAASDYIEIAKSNPQTMGKSKACYSSLIRLTSVYARLARA